MSKEGSNKEFSGLRAIFWPIHNYELKKFLPMGFMMFCALFNYTIVRDVKDALVVKAAGAETISFIKFWIVTPMAVMIVLLYTKASSVLSREKLFYYTLAPFVVFFAAFGFILYPNRAAMLPSMESVEGLIAAAPAMRYFIMMYAKWIYVLFYACAELWGSVVVSLLFWQFANQITRVFEAKRYYAMFGIIGNLGLILSGQTLKGLTIYGAKMAESAGGTGNPFDYSIQYILGAFTIFGILYMFLYNWTNKNVLSDPRLFDPGEVKPKKKKEKPSLSESLKIVFSSKYLLMIFILVMGYGISINLVEVTWKKQLGKRFASMNEYTAFMGDFSTYTGFITILLMIVGQNIVRIFGWYVAALATPLMLLGTSSIFFSSVIFKDSLSGVMAMLSTTPLMMAVMVGMIQNILSKATKYSLFDSTKEMSYIPLDDDLKTKGKAAVDVVGGRAGKAGGALIQQILLVTIAGNVANGQDIIAPYLFVFVAIIITLWVWAVRNLNKKFSEKTAEREAEAAAAK